MPTPRRPILSQLLLTTTTALAVVTLYLYLTRPSAPVIHQTRLHDHLTRNITVSFTDRPLTEAIAGTAAEIGLPIDVDWPALATMGATPEQPVTLRLKGVPAHTVLSALLAQIPSDGPLTWAERQDRVLISDPAGTRNPIVRVYDIRDLVDEYAAFRRSVPNEEYDVLDPTTAGNVAQGWNSTLAEEFATDELMSMLQQAVEPDSWTANGGTFGDIHYAMNRLAFAQSAGAQEKIQRILLALRLRDTTEINAPDRSTP